MRYRDTHKVTGVPLDDRHADLQLSTYGRGHDRNDRFTIACRNVSGGQDTQRVTGTREKIHAFIDELLDEMQS